MESTALDLDRVFNDELARQAFKCSIKVKILEDGDAIVLDIFHLDAVITVTV